MITTSGITTAKRTWGTPSFSVAEMIKRVDANDSSLHVVDLSNSASFQMRSDEFAGQLAEALKKNTHVRELNLTNCGIGDRGGEHLGESLAENRSIVTLILEKNRLNQHGASALAKGLARNKKLESINLMNQTNARWGDTCLDDFIEMFYSNITLLKIYWRLESRKSFAINKFLTRNNEIDRRRKNGMSYDDLLPEAVRGSDQVSDSKQGRPALPNGHEAEQPPPPPRAIRPASADIVKSQQYPSHESNGAGGRHGADARAGDDGADKAAASQACGSLRDRMKMFEQTNGGGPSAPPSPGQERASWRSSVGAGAGAPGGIAAPSPSLRGPAPAADAPARRWGSATASVADIIRRVAANDPSLVLVDVSNSASYQTRSDDYTAQALTTPPRPACLASSS
jgi:hypothetical protein